MDILCYAGNMQKGYNPERQSKGFAVVYILIGTLVIAGAIVAGAYLVKQTTNFKPKATSPVVQNTPKPNITPSPTSTDETSSWKTCENKEYGFSIKYPQDYYEEVDQKSSQGFPLKCLLLQPKESLANKKPLVTTYKLSIGVANNTGNLTLDKPENLLGNGPVTTYKWSDFKNEASIREIIFDNFKAYRADKCCGGMAGAEADIMTIKNNKVYEIFIEPHSVSEKEDDFNKKIYEQILSTFKFLDQASSPGVCKITGCNREICADNDIPSTCVILPEHGCYRSAKCERQTDGKCGWTSTEELNKCLSKFQSK